MSARRGTPSRPRPVVLCVLDGWGHRLETRDNAIAMAATPAYDRMLARWPHSLLAASGAAVGLEDGQMGNSEVGHMSLGAGRILVQDLPRIDAAIADGTLSAAPALADLVAKLRRSGGTCHLMGLLSPGGVHAHQRHIAVLARLLAARGIDFVVHGFLDGRDTPPKSAAEHLAAFAAAAPSATIATLSGRYFAMDRDHRWPRVARAYAAIAAAEGAPAGDWREALKRAYAAGQSDEFVVPAVIGAYAGIKDGDGVLMANFRADRVRQLLSALVEPDFEGFARPAPPALAAACGMVSYSERLDARFSRVLEPVLVDEPFGAVIAAAGMRQLRLAETEKYAHVTFFFNGGAEGALAGEDRVLVPSPKVATYDRAPEMAALEVTARLEAAIESQNYDFVLVNYANPDMVGHTGNLDAAVTAVETVDACLARLESAVTDAGGALVVTSDHGNVECMREPGSDEPMTAHSTAAVPLIVGPAALGIARLDDGRLADVAPSLLALLGLPQPAAMKGRSLIGRASDAAAPTLVEHAASS